MTNPLAVATWQALGSHEFLHTVLLAVFGPDCALKGEKERTGLAPSASKCDHPKSLQSWQDHGGHRHSSSKRYRQFDACRRKAMPIEGETLVQFMTMQRSHYLSDCRGIPASRMARRSIKESFGRKLCRGMFLLSVVAVMPGLSRMAASQSFGTSGDAGMAASTTSGQLSPIYVRPTQKTKFNNFLFDGFGPYPIAGVAVAAGINQLSNEPPEWNQGVAGYSRRFGSDLGIVAVGTTARYGLAEALREDTLYYRCECKGLFPRLRHAVISTVIARRGNDGHRVFSFPALVAPYAGTFTAVYGWYPDRFGAKDAFRMGNYSLLAYVGSNISREFFYSGPRSLFSRLHLNNTHGSPDQGPNH